MNSNQPEQFQKKTNYHGTWNWIDLITKYTHTHTVSNRRTWKKSTAFFTIRKNIESDSINYSVTPRFSSVWNLIKIQHIHNILRVICCNTYNCYYSHLPTLNELLESLRCLRRLDTGTATGLVLLGCGERGPEPGTPWLDRLPNPGKGGLDSNPDDCRWGGHVVWTL